MRYAKMIEFWLLHIAVACSIACIVFKILDWYNPFMDFQGHGQIIQWGLYISTILAGLIRTMTTERKKVCRGRKRNSRQ